MAARMLLPLVLPVLPSSPLAHTIIYLLLLLLLAPPFPSFAAVLRLLNVTLRICQRASPEPVAAQCQHLHALPPTPPTPASPAHPYTLYYSLLLSDIRLAMTLRSVLLCFALCSQHTMALVAFRRFHSQLVLLRIPPSSLFPFPCSVFTLSFFLLLF